MFLTIAEISAVTVQQVQPYSLAIDTNELQRDLDNIGKGCKQWELYLNADKCTVMHLSRKNTRIYYQLNEFTLYKAGHTASDEADNINDNIDFCKIIQDFHMFSREWDDIAYNFLIGADANIYEGRGWGVIGSHTYRYNKFSVGIAMIGCFNEKLPNRASLEQVKSLINYGVESEYIAKDYILLAHCQSFPGRSPGIKFYEELQTWDHFDPSISVNNPSPLILH